MYNPALVYTILNSNIEQITSRITVLFQALQQLQHQGLAVTLLGSTQLQIVPTCPQDLFQLDTTYIHQKDELLIIAHIPCSVAADTLTLYEYYLTLPTSS
jgi:hypothetical protein